MSDHYIFTKKFSKDVGIFVLQNRSNLIFPHCERNICIFIANNSENPKCIKKKIIIIIILRRKLKSLQFLHWRMNSAYN